MIPPFLVLFSRLLFLPPFPFETGNWLLFNWRSNGNRGSIRDLAFFPMGLKVFIFFGGESRFITKGRKGGGCGVHSSEVHDSYGSLDIRVMVVLPIVFFSIFFFFTSLLVYVLMWYGFCVYDLGL